MKIIYWPRRTIGGWTIYQRLPKMKGPHRYCVGTSTKKDFVNFHSYAKAIAWMKEREADAKIYRMVIGPPRP